MVDTPHMTRHERLERLHNLQRFLASYTHDRLSPAVGRKRLLDLRRRELNWNWLAL